MGVMLQAFYWDCPRAEKKEFKWWKHVSKQIPALAQVGFTSLWLPPVHQHDLFNAAPQRYRFAIWRDRLMRTWPGFRNQGDHFVMVLRYQPQD